jgi:hypothetical protein
VTRVVTFVVGLALLSSSVAAWAVPPRPAGGNNASTPTTLSALYNFSGTWTTRSSWGSVPINVQWPAALVAICNGTWSRSTNKGWQCTAADQSITISSVTFNSGLTRATYSTGTNPPSCIETLSTGAYCELAVSVGATSSGSRSASVVLTDSSGNRYPIPFGWTGVSQSVVRETCSALNGATLSASTIYVLGDVTCNDVTFHTGNNSVLLGDCSDALGAKTVLDGSGVSASTPMTNGREDGKTGVTVGCLTVQKYTGTHAANCLYNQMVTYDAWLLIDDTFQEAGCNGVDLQGAATITDSLVAGNGTEGVFSEPGYSTQSGTPIQTISSVEMTGNGSTDSESETAAGSKSVPNACNERALSTQGVTYEYNYVHKTIGVGLWVDCWSTNVVMLSNTVIGSDQPGLMCEISVGCNISDNVLQNNNADGSLISGDIFISSSSDVTASGNFLLVANQTHNGGPMAQADCRSDAPQDEVSVSVSGNTVVFAGYTAGGGVDGLIDHTNLGANCSGGRHPTAWTYYSSSNNSFQSPSTSDPHWTGNAQRYYTNQTLTQIKASPYDNESGSILVTSGISTPNGCQHVGCPGTGW